jgi:hypothetical protein
MQKERTMTIHTLFQAMMSHSKQAKSKKPTHYAPAF